MGAEASKGWKVLPEKAETPAATQDQSVRQSTPNKLALAAPDGTDGRVAHLRPGLAVEGEDLGRRTAGADGSAARGAEAADAVERAAARRSRDVLRHGPRRAVPGQDLVDRARIVRRGSAEGQPGAGYVGSDEDGASGRKRGLASMSTRSTCTPWKRGRCRWSRPRRPCRTRRSCTTRSRSAPLFAFAGRPNRLGRSTWSRSTAAATGAPVPPPPPPTAWQKVALVQDTP